MLYPEVKGRLNSYFSQSFRTIFLQFIRQPFLSSSYLKPALLCIESID